MARLWNEPLGPRARPIKTRYMFLLTRALTYIDGMAVYYAINAMAAGLTTLYIWMCTEYTYGNLP